MKIFTRGLPILFACAFLLACGDEVSESSEIPGWNSQPPGGEPTAPTNAAAQFVGAWYLTSNCPGEYDFENFALFVCPGGHIRGAGEMNAGVIESICGTYTASDPVYADCTDKLGCYPGAVTDHTSILAVGGETDTDYHGRYDFFSIGHSELAWYIHCGDGSVAQMQRATGTVTDDNCVSATCSASGSSSGGYGSCGTDCDCGYCWYCENGTCRYGGQGPYGCYRGCPWE